MEDCLPQNLLALKQRLHYFQHKILTLLGFCDYRCFFSACNITITVTLTIYSMFSTLVIFGLTTNGILDTLVSLFLLSLHIRNALPTTNIHRMIISNVMTTVNWAVDTKFSEPLLLSDDDDFPSFSEIQLLYQLYWWVNYLTLCRDIS